MNFYKHHIGDYDADTAHLSMLEDAAYSRLMRAYYRTEKPIPADIKQACRLVRAMSKAERDAVGVVLNEFFTLESDGWHNKRCDIEIAEFHEGDDEREQKAANEAERVKRYRERRKQLFETLRSRGLVPKWDTKMEELERLCNAPVTRTGDVLERGCNAPITANQNPESRIQNPETTTSTSKALQRAPEPEPINSMELAIELATTLRSCGVNCNAHHPSVIELAKQGVTKEMAVSAVLIARDERGKATPSIGYLMPIINDLETRMREPIAAKGKKAQGIQSLQELISD